MIEGIKEWLGHEPSEEEKKAWAWANYILRERNLNSFIAIYEKKLEQVACKEYLKKASSSQALPKHLGLKGKKGEQN